jgi:hypothetical protein
MYIDSLKELVITQLGKMAWEHIRKGHPTIANGYVWFWIDGQECAWGIDTAPVLLMQLESEKEFSTFTELLEEIRGESQSPATPLSGYH